MIADKAVDDFLIEVIEGEGEEETNRLAYELSLGNRKNLVYNCKFEWLDKTNPDHAIEVLKYPPMYIGRGKSLVEKRLGAGLVIDFKVTDLPHDTVVPVKNIREEHYGKLICVEGMVKKITEVKSRVKIAHFFCQKCGDQSDVFQESMVFTQPLPCTKCHGGGKWMFDHEHSSYANYQKLEIQEAPEGLRGGQQPGSLIGYVEGSDVGKLYPGNRVTLNGIMELDILKEKLESPIIDKRIKILSFDFHDHDFDEMETTEEELSKIRDYARSPNAIEMLVRSMSPSIKGYEDIKEALLLQLFGGTSKTLEDGTELRGEIHILLTGDPGIAKSQMVRYSTQVAPRGVYASGRGSSSAGLTAAAVKDDFGEGKWTLEAGAMVLADGGFIGLDEMDKMEPKERQALLEAMEDRKITIHKAGINAELPTRCAVLGACNPKYGRFQDGESIDTQITLESPLLSRFDLIFIMQDKPDNKTDEGIARHMLRNHLQGQRIRKGEAIEDTGILSKDFMRKWISEARKLTPTLTEEVMDIFVSNYLKIRRGSSATIGITPRQLDGYVRLAEASARIRLSDEITKEDAMRAVKVVSECYKKILPDGDIDVVMTGFPKKKKEVIALLKVILGDQIGKQMQVSELKKIMFDSHVSEATVDSIIQELHNAAEITKPKQGMVKLV
jgi:replicative DNA helicase Mcm